MITNQLARRLIFTTVIVLVCCGESGLAQGLAPSRPPQGLFGGIRPDANATTRLDFDASLIGGYDNDVAEEFLSIVDPSNLQGGGYTTMLNANASYSWSGSRTTIGANATSTVRHYSELGEIQNVGQSAGVGFSARLPWRTSLFVNQSASYSPAYFYGLFSTAPTDTPGYADTTRPDFAVNGFDSYTYTTQVSLGRDLTNRDSLSVSGQYDYSDRVGEREQWTDVSSYGINARYARQVGANTALAGEARYRAGEYAYQGEGVTTEAGVGFSIDHTKVLSASRRAVIRADFGIASIDLPDSVVRDVSFSQQYRGVGGIGFVYQFGRTWQTRLDVRRRVEYLPELPRPVFAGGVSWAVDGLLSRRVDISMSADYSNGASALNELNQDNQEFVTYAGNVRIRYAWNRTIATYGEYLYYFYDFHNRAILRAGIPSSLERNGVRIGLTVWVPAIRR